MRGTVHEPQVNIGADQKFSPIDVFKQEKKGDKPWNFNRLIKRQTAPLSSLQNGQVTKQDDLYNYMEQISFQKFYNINFNTLTF